MRVFVIKNKEGKYYKKYFSNGYIEFTDNVLDAEMYFKDYGAEDLKDYILRNKYKFNIETLDVVEFTLVEGDLERENRNLNIYLSNYKKELEKFRDMSGKFAIENLKLEIQLKDKDHKIAVLEKALEEMYDDLSDVCSALPSYDWYTQQAEENIDGNGTRD